MNGTLRAKLAIYQNLQLHSVISLKYCAAAVDILITTMHGENVIMKSSFTCDSTCKRGH